MVQRARRQIVWSENAIQNRKDIFEYWKHRNKSSSYGKQLNTLFTAALRTVASLPDSANPTTLADVRMILVHDYYLIFQFTERIIIVLNVWDTRQNPQNFPIK